MSNAQAGLAAFLVLAVLFRCHTNTFAIPVVAVTLKADYLV
jgi:hypothetical protein